MSNTAKLISGALTASAISFTAGDLNSLASGGAALGSTVIANSTNLDTFIDFSFIVTVGGTTTASSTIAIYLLPLNQDASTYGDAYASSSSTQPAPGYQVGYINVKSGITSGNTVVGSVLFGNLAPVDYKVVFANNLGVALNATAALTLKCSTFNLNLNG